MTRQGVTVTALAEQVGRSRSYVNSVLTGWSPLPPTLRDAIAAALDIDPADVVGRDRAAA